MLRATSSQAERRSSSFIFQVGSGKGCGRSAPVPRAWEWRRSENTDKLRGVLVMCKNFLTWGCCPQIKIDSCLHSSNRDLREYFSFLWKNYFSPKRRIVVELPWTKSLLCSHSLSCSVPHPDGQVSAPRLILEFGIGRPGLPISRKTPVVDVTCHVVPAHSTVI
jgi:hypothetical protein